MDRRLIWFLVLLAPVLAWSWIGPHDRFTWWLESAPAVVGVPLIVVLQKRFPLSSLLLVLLWLHCVLLVTGGHYTYALVPLGVKTLDKAVELNTEFAKTSYEGLVAQATKMGELYTSLAKEAFKPVEEAFAKVQVAAK